MIESLSQSSPQLEAVVGRLCVEDHIETVVAVVDHIRLEDLRQLEARLVARSILVLEVIVNNRPVELVRVLEVLEQLLILCIDDEHHRFESRHPSSKVLAFEPLEVYRVADRTTRLRYHVEMLVLLELLAQVLAVVVAAAV